MDTTPIHLDTSYLDTHGIQLGAGAMAYIKGLAKKHRRSRIIAAQLVAVPADGSSVGVASRGHLTSYLGDVRVTMMCDGTVIYTFYVHLGGWRSVKPD